jgi:glucose-6-phosphate dehydrogenase assembly protein OpcA
MANTYKILGQVSPSATTPADLYTVPSSTSTVISSIVICNRGTTATAFRVSISPAGNATANKDYLYYDVILAGNDTFIATVGITLATTDKVRIYAGNANLSFNLFGTEIS